jgi:subtilisin
LEISRLIEQLLEEVHSSNVLAKRHILHFHSRDVYHTFLREWTKRRKDTLLRKEIQVFKIIGAISCRIGSSKVLQDLSKFAYLEEDGRIALHRAEPQRKLAVSANASAVNPLLPWGINHIKAPQVWKATVGRGVHIGVIDTGIDATHPDLFHAVRRGVNLLYRGMLPYDDNGHGTHIAGIIAAASRDGLVGVAPQALIHPVKSFDKNGSAFVSDIIAGIDWCVYNEMDIINMSFGMKLYSKALEQAVQNAFSAGKIIIASCGNDGRSASIDYPAKFKQVVSVGAITRSAKIAPFSNKGSRIDIYAPGERITSCWLRGSYNELSGTSMATAHVSGVVALLLAKYPALRTPDIKFLLKRGSSALRKSSGEPLAAGQLNARRVLALARKDEL